MLSAELDTDLDWAVAARHKLIPSVYAGIKFKMMRMEVQQQLAIFHPPVWSGKHASSTASAHGLDYERDLHLPEFE